MKTGFAFATLVWLAGAAVAQPRLHVRQAYADAGSHPQDATFSVSYALRNAGDAELRIAEVHNECECITVVGYPKTLAAGQTGAVELEVRTRDLKGPQERSLTIVSNDPKIGQASLRLDFSSGVAAQVTPGLVWLGAAAPGATLTGRLSVESLTNSGGKIVAVIPKDPGVIATVLDSVIGPEAAGVIEIRASSPTVGLLDTTLSIETTLPGKPVLFATVRGLFSELMAGDLAHVDVGVVNGHSRGQLRIPMTWSSTHPPQVITARPSGWGAWFDSPAGKTAMVIEYAAIDRPEPVRGYITMRSPHPEKIRFTLPVRAMVRSRVEIVDESKPTQPVVP